MLGKCPSIKGGTWLSTVSPLSSLACSSTETSMRKSQDAHPRRSPTNPPRCLPFCTFNSSTFTSSEAHHLQLNNTVRSSSYRAKAQVILFITCQGSTEFSLFAPEKQKVKQGHSGFAHGSFLHALGVHAQKSRRDWAIAQAKRGRQTARGTGMT